MKKRNAFFPLAATILLMSVGCSDNPTTDTQANNDSATTTTTSAPPVAQAPQGTMCFTSTNAEGHQFTVRFTFQGDSVQGTSDETVGWTGEPCMLSGNLRGDTLKMVAQFRDGADGDYVEESVSYLLRADKLTGKKDVTKNEFDLEFNKVECQ